MNLSEYSRRPSGEVRIGRVVIGGGRPVAVQSMTNTDTNDTEASAAQIERIDRAVACRSLRYTPDPKKIRSASPVLTLRALNVRRV